MQKCDKHNVELECMGGRSAHADNWYCPECDKGVDDTKVNTEAAGQHERLVMPRRLNMGIIYKTIQIPNLWYYAPEYNADGTEKHICCDGARFHVLSYSTDGIRCSEPKCELNKRHND